MVLRSSWNQVGLKALRMIIRAHDGSGRKTLLSKTILKEIKLKNILDLTEWVHKIPFQRLKLEN